MGTVVVGTAGVDTILVVACTRLVHNLVIEVGIILVVVCNELVRTVEVASDVVE